jgi:hypothetical protein
VSTNSEEVHGVQRCACGHPSRLAKRLAPQDDG